MTDEIAVRENTKELSIAVSDHRRAGPHIRHCFQDAAHSCIRSDQGQGFSRPHNLMDASEQAPADCSARMEAGEIFLLKSARLEQDHRNRVAESEHDGRA